MVPKTAIITGANTGIGLALCKQLLQSDPSIHLCLACRSSTRAEAARAHLLKLFPLADIAIELLDVANMKSVYTAATQLRKRYPHIDYLYLNAGIMGETKMDWEYFWKNVFSKNVGHMFTTGDGLLQQIDVDTVDGLRGIFATNLFGHFLLIRELETSLGGSSEPSQIIWTSSSNAQKAAFSLDDIEHRHGREPYSSSKYAVDLTSLAINERLNQLNIFSHVTCPGLVVTNLTYGILPAWFWTLLLPLMLLLRLVVPTMSITPEKGSGALFWLSQQSPQQLDPMKKYVSQTSITGHSYVRPVQMPVDSETAAALYERLAWLQHNMRVSGHKTS